MSWTPAERQRVLELDARGWGPAAIAMMTGKTRNAVIGLLWREGRRGAHRSPLSAAERRARSPVRSRGRRPPAACEPPPRPAAPAPAPAPRVPLPLPSPHRTCQFIAADPRSDPTKCGRPTRPGSSYCGEHHARCWVPLPKRGELAAEGA
jgi:hypothetical protein